jgi:hypothetical protein
MGLDAVELVMSVEEIFGIDLPDQDAATLTTPRKLIDYVCARVGATSRERCISQRSFYRVRRILAAASGASAREIGPGTHLETLLPVQARRRLWASLASQIGLRRTLTRPRWVVWATQALCAAAFVVAARSFTVLGVLAGLGATVVVGGVLALATAPLAVRLDVTAGDLAREAIPVVLASDEAAGSPGWTRDAVAETCRLLIR